MLQSYRGQAATVRVNRELTARAGTPGGRSVRHLEIALPAGSTYAAGDHLGVLPRNDIGAGQPGASPASAWTAASSSR